MTLSVEVTIENIFVYRRAEKLLLYIVARQEQALLKVFSDVATPTDLFKLSSCTGPVQFDVTMNKYLTSTYKGNTIPFYDFISYKTSHVLPMVLGSSMNDQLKTD